MSVKKWSYCIFICVLFVINSNAQHTICGKLKEKNSNISIPFALIFIEETNIHTKTDENGKFCIENLKNGTYPLVVSYNGYATIKKNITIKGKNVHESFDLEPIETTLNEVEVEFKREKTFGMAHMRDVEGFGIYSGKKSELILVDDITANTAGNNARQVFSKIAGLNIWESDGAGLQLSIGARGLNPSRTSAFNTRINGYDLSADAIGYPESYYTPPVDALESIQVIRGAASLQYGTQFGGLLNFITRKPVKNKKIELSSKQTIGSYGFFNSFNSISGINKKISYYSYIQYKKGNGWRENSNFDMKSGFLSMYYQPSKIMKIGLELTSMHYLAQQAGGLTDKMFEQNPQQSIRDRNWFDVTWNLAAITFDYNISEKTKINSKMYSLLATRKALGFLGNINRIDPLENRDLLADKYQNFGNETRLIHRYNLFKQTSNFLVGIRLYQGHLERKQGAANDSYNPDFYFIKDDETQNSSFVFPSRNFSFFMENIFRLSDKLSVTPGVRFEHISTHSDGFYTVNTTDLVGQIIESRTVQETMNRKRQFMLMGIGFSYAHHSGREIYANFSQNYRAITFNDLRVVNPNLKVDENLKDENGFNADLGTRGSWKNTIMYDVTFFYLSYNNRIGLVQQVDENTYRAYRLRTNVADARTVGVESFFECDIVNLLSKKENKFGFAVFSNLTYLTSNYLHSDESAFEGKKVELVPDFLARFGATIKSEKFSLTYNFSYTSEHFTDATNAEFTPNAVNGLVYAYYIMDISARYTFKKLTVDAGCNNLTNNLYFTRRADGYPGPGIIPSDGRTFYVTLGIKL